MTRPIEILLMLPASGASVLLIDTTSARATSGGSGFSPAPTRLYVATTVLPGAGAGAGGCCTRHNLAHLR